MNTSAGTLQSTWLHNFMPAYSVGDDNLLGEDLASALRSLQNLTAMVTFLQHVQSSKLH